MSAALYDFIMGVEAIVAKGKIAYDELVLIFPQSLQKKTLIPQFSTMLLNNFSKNMFKSTLL